MVVASSPAGTEHAAFIDGLSEQGTIPVGGPIGNVDGQHSLLVVRAGSAEEARAMLADDPWRDNILRIESVEPWTLWIGADKLAVP